MALILTKLKRAAFESRRMLQPRYFSHVSAISPPLGGAIDLPTTSPSPILPEVYQDQSDSIDEKTFIFGFPRYSFGGFMELMAVPKKRSCGRVKLPHFYCCSGERSIPDEQSNLNN